MDFLLKRSLESNFKNIPFIKGWSKDDSRVILESPELIPGWIRGGARMVPGWFRGWSEYVQEWSLRGSGMVLGSFMCDPG